MRPAARMVGSAAGVLALFAWVAVAAFLRRPGLAGSESWLVAIVVALLAVICSGVWAVSRIVGSVSEAYRLGYEAARRDINGATVPRLHTVNERPYV